MLRHYLLRLHHHGATKTLAGVVCVPSDPGIIIIVYRWVQTLFVLCLNLNSVAGSKELTNNLSLSENQICRFSALCTFYQTSLLVCFRGFVCFKLLAIAARSYLVYASRHWSPVIGLSCRRSRWLWCVFSNHIPSLLPLSKQLVHCTVAM